MLTHLMPWSRWGVETPYHVTPLPTLGFLIVISTCSPAFDFSLFLYAGPQRAFLFFG
jgi:hypothetical protein